MKKVRGFSSVAIAFALIWALAVFADAQAQGKGPEKDKKKNEQVIERANGGSEAAKVKYIPREMTDKDMMEWTDGDPPGWSRGNKIGWGGAGAPPGQMKKYGEREIIHIYPPGSESWDTQRKEDWESKLEQSEVRILQRIRTSKGTSQEYEQSAMISIEEAARAGVPLEYIEATMNRAITSGMGGRDIEEVTRAMSYGTDKDVDYNRLDQFIEKGMDEGETGDDLALSIYREIDERHAAKLQEPVKKSWWKRLFGG